MKVTVHDRGSIAIAEVHSMDTGIDGVQDALDLMVHLQYEYGAQVAILRKEHLPTEFFDLRSGLAGEILQKASNYHFRLAIVGDFEATGSTALRDFIRESNDTGEVLFLPNVESVLARF